MWDEFEEKVTRLFEFTNGRKVIIWGYQRSGWFVEHLFKRAHKQVEYIIDDGTGFMPKVNIQRSIVLQRLDRDVCAVLLTFEHDRGALELLEDLGYVEGENYIFVKKLFYGDAKGRMMSYYDWLEYKFHADISAPRTVDKLKQAHSDCLQYSVGIDYALVDVLDNFAFKENDAVFDFGCGKGGALALFRKAGVGKLGGVEYDPDLYQIGQSNLQKLNMENVSLLNTDATLLDEELDGYNYFFMYNPFLGDTFEKVICNIERSYNRRRRQIVFIYSGPYCHDLVIQNNVFKLSKEIYTDYSVRYVYIYMISE